MHIIKKYANFNVYRSQVLYKYCFKSSFEVINKKPTGLMLQMYEYYLSSKAALKNNIVIIQVSVVDYIYFNNSVNFAMFNSVHLQKVVSILSSDQFSSVASIMKQLRFNYKAALQKTMPFSSSV